MKRLLVPLTVLALAAFLRPLAIPTARACSCDQLTAQQAADQADVVLIGSLVSWEQTPSKVVKEGNVSYEYGYRTKATISVSRYLKGRGPSSVDVVDDPCVGGGIARDWIGQEHLLFLRMDQRFEEWLETGACLGSGPVSTTIGPNCLAPATPTPEGCIGPQTVTHPLLAQVNGITGPGQPPDDALPGPLPSHTATFPYLPTTLAAAAASLLAASAWLLRRRIMGGDDHSHL